MRIVKKGDEFALAKWRWIFTRVADLRVHGFWWSPYTTFQKYCWGSLEDVRKARNFWEKTHEKWEDYNEED